MIGFSVGSAAIISEDVSLPRIMVFPCAIAYMNFPALESGTGAEVNDEEEIVLVSPILSTETVDGIPISGIRRDPSIRKSKLENCCGASSCLEQAKRKS